MLDLTEMKENLERMPTRMEEALIKYGKTSAALLQGEAQKNRPWRDHTHDARERIKGYCVRTDRGIDVYKRQVIRHMPLAMGKRDAGSDAPAEGFFLLICD